MEYRLLQYCLYAGVASSGENNKYVHLIHIEPFKVIRYVQWDINDELINLNKDGWVIAGDYKNLVCIRPWIDNHGYHQLPLFSVTAIHDQVFISLAEKLGSESIHDLINVKCIVEIDPIITDFSIKTSSIALTMIENLRDEFK